MWLIVIAILLGVAVGYFGVIPEKYNRFTNRLTTFGLIVLLVAMGAKIGSNQEMLANLKVMGLKSLLLAVFAVIGSIVFAWLLEIQMSSRVNKQQNTEKER